jgi:hypothetical protein
VPALRPIRPDGRIEFAHAVVAQHRAVGIANEMKRVLTFFGRLAVAPNIQALDGPVGAGDRKCGAIQRRNLRGTATFRPQQDRMFRRSRSGKFETARDIASGGKDNLVARPGRGNSGTQRTGIRDRDGPQRDDIGGIRRNRPPQHQRVRRAADQNPSSILGNLRIDLSRGIPPGQRPRKPVRTAGRPSQ